MLVLCCSQHQIPPNMSNKYIEINWDWNWKKIDLKIVIELPDDDGDDHDKYDDSDDGVSDRVISNRCWHSWQFLTFDKLWLQIMKFMRVT